LGERLTSVRVVMILDLASPDGAKDAPIPAGSAAYEQQFGPVGVGRAFLLRIALEGGNKRIFGVLTDRYGTASRYVKLHVNYAACEGVAFRAFLMIRPWRSTSR